MIFSPAAAGPVRARQAFVRERGRECVLQRRDFVIGGYTPAGRNSDAGWLLRGSPARVCRQGARWLHAGAAGGCVQAIRRTRDQAMPVSGICLSHGLVSGGVTAAEMEKCRWLKPRLVAAIEYLERTAANHLRHAMFSGLTEERGTVPLAI